MSFSVCFIERRDADTQSLEKVFRIVARELNKQGLKTRFQKLPGGNGLLGILYNLMAFRPAAADIYHITGHVHAIGLRLPTEKTVLTVHDLWILHNRAGLRRWLLKKILFDWPLRRLKWITAISEATKTELIEIVGAEPDSIEMIPNPVEIPRPDMPRSFNSERPTVLQVGTAAHKNLEVVAAALSGIRCRLRIVGPLSDEQLRILNENQIDFQSEERLDEPAMNAAYRSADLLVFCSQFEGFGLPIVEAQAVGLPIVTSDREPMRSTAGRGALLADPHDPASIRSAVEEIVRNRELRSTITESGFVNVLRFTPEVIANQYVTLYKRMLDMK